MVSRTAHQARRPSRPYLETNVPPQPAARYSYQQTPVEMQRSVFQQFSSPTNSVIDESPLTPGSSRQPPGYDHTVRQPTPLPEEKALEAKLAAPPQRAHPAYSAPIAEQAPSPHPAHSPPPQQLQPQPPTSPGPLPLKQHGSSTPMTSSAANTDPKLGNDRADSYNPYALQWTNVNTANHRPGQVMHPNAVKEPHWKHGLCEPDALCCMGIFCPCLVYGKTMYRLSRRAEKKDPTDVLGYERCNGSCGIFALACGVQGILAAIHRTRIRKLYHIEGSFGADCMKGCCCCCFVVAQNEREVKSREEMIRQHAGPVTGAYTSPTGGMDYAPPPPR